VTAVGYGLKPRSEPRPPSGKVGTKRLAAVHSTDWFVGDPSRHLLADASRN